MSFNYFEALPAEAKERLNFSEVEELVGIFQRFDKTRVGSVAPGQVNALVAALAERYGAAHSFYEAFSSYTATHPLSFLDCVKVRYPFSQAVVAIALPNYILTTSEES